MALLKAAVADGVRTRAELRSVRKDGGLSETCTGLGPPEPSGSHPASALQRGTRGVARNRYHISSIICRLPGIGVISHLGDAVAAVKKVISQWPTLSESP